MVQLFCEEVLCFFRARVSSDAVLVFEDALFLFDGTFRGVVFLGIGDMLFSLSDREDCEEDKEEEEEAKADEDSPEDELDEERSGITLVRLLEGPFLVGLFFGAGFLFFFFSSSSLFPLLFDLLDRAFFLLIDAASLLSLLVAGRLTTPLLLVGIKRPSDRKENKGSSETATFKSSLVIIFR